MKRKRFLHPFVAVLSLGIFAEAFLLIAVYAQTVNVEYGIKAGEKAVAEFKLSNVDLRNQLYGVLDTKRLMKIAAEEGLTPEGKPAYLKLRNGSGRLTRGL